MLKFRKTPNYLQLRERKLKSRFQNNEIIHYMRKLFTPKGEPTSAQGPFSFPRLSLSLSFFLFFSPFLSLAPFALADDKHPLTFQLSYYFYPAWVTGHKGSLSIESTLSVQLSGVPAARTIANNRASYPKAHDHL